MTIMRAAAGRFGKIRVRRTIIGLVLAATLAGCSMYEMMALEAVGQIADLYFDNWEFSADPLVNYFVGKMMGF